MNAANAEPVLMFDRLDRPEDLRTGTALVSIRRTGKRIGEIRWMVPWRQYAFFADDGVGLNVRALLELRQHLKVMMKAWSKREGNIPLDDEKKEKWVKP